MPVYYQDFEVTVTDAVIAVGGHTFRIADLQYVWHQHGRPTWRTIGRRLNRLILIAFFTAPLAASGVVVGNLAFAGPGLAGRIGAALVLIALGLIALTVLVPLIEFPLMALERSYDRGTAVREIWVRWRDQDLILLRTTDASRFGRIYRAIQRAVERSEG